MNDMTDFFTLDGQNEGIEVPLTKPSGEASEHKLNVIGHFSDAYQRARREFMRSASEVAKLKGDEERFLAIKERQLKLTASLITSWTFPMECTMANKIEFLRKAPLIGFVVDQVAGEQALFLKSSSPTSDDTQNGALSSAASQPEA